MSSPSDPRCCACQTPVPSGAQFCSQCGTPVPGRRTGTGLTPIEPTPTTPDMTQLRVDAGPAKPAPGGSLVDGKYVVLERLGGGGFGEVFRVRDTLLGREFALKTLHTHLASNPQVRERFVREARVLMDLQHPGLVPTRHLGEWRGMIYLVMDLVIGQPLSSLLQQRTRLPGRDAAAIAVEVLRALEYAHGRGVLHRDLKPSNLLIESSAAGKWDVRLLDFGVAKVLDQGRLSDGDWKSLATGGPVGTWHYMSPEQIGLAQSEPGPDSPVIDARSDLYSLGVVVYETITGCVPFRSAQVLRLILDVQESPPPSFRAAGVDEDVVGLEAWVMRALAKQPEQRFASAAEMRTELERLLGGVATAVPGTPVPAATRITPRDGSRVPRPSDPFAEARTHVPGTPVPATMPPPAPAAEPARAAVVAAPPPPSRRRWGLLPLATLAALVLVAAIAVVYSGAHRPVADTPQALALRVEPAGSGRVDRVTAGDSGTVQLQATAGEHFRFVEWSDGVKDNPRTLAPSATPVAVSLTARFRSLRQRVEFQANPASSGTIVASQPGAEFDAGTELQVTATPGTGWYFVTWSDGESGATRTVVVPDRDLTLSAVFKRAQSEARPLRVDPEGAGHAELIPSEKGDRPGAPGEAVATAADGWRFVSWSDGIELNPRTLTIPESGGEPTAQFERERVEVEVECIPATAGQVSFDPVADADGTWEFGAEITLVAIPAEGWRFGAWEDQLRAAERKVTAGSGVDLEARFIPVVEVTAMPEAGGSAVVLPAEYEFESALQLIAAPREGWRFVGWSDGNRAAVRTVTADAPLRLEARFEQGSTRIFAAAEPANGGSVTPADGHFLIGAELRLAAMPAPGWRFAGWTDGVTEPVRTVVLDETGLWVARFERLLAVDLRVEPPGAGVVLPAASEVAEGAEIDLSATPAPGWRFLGWSDGVTEATRRLQVAESVHLIARFERDGGAAIAGPRTTPAAAGLSPAVPGLKALPVQDGRAWYLHEASGIELVKIDAAKPYLLGRTEVTNAQYRRFHADHASGDFRGATLDSDEQPVVNVSWSEAAAFCNHFGLRLVRRAEWQDATQRDATWPPGPDAGNFGDAALADLTKRGPKDELRNRNDGYAVTAPVGAFPHPGGPGDAVGVKDLVGNVWEWCEDRFGDQYRVVVGGSWSDSPGELERLEYQNSHPETWEDGGRTPRERGGREDGRDLRLRVGFRVAMDLPAR